MNLGKEITRLVASADPSIRYKVRVNVLGEDPNSASVRALRAEIRRGPVVTALLRNMDSAGAIRSHRGVYDKWQGAHWVLSALADIGYPDFSGVDLLLTMLMRWSRNQPRKATDWPHLKALASLVCARPSWKKLYELEGLSEWTP